ncbi:MAG: alanine--tRNA ligase [Bacteroidetes bacterium]|nr:MAG: alanine--tRNA ligase [Bacteroidota bacterium]
MNSISIRQTFFDFFESKSHFIEKSAPMVVKNDPTLMFTNAGMNQFKDIFLGNSPAKNPRVANTQKCLRVSGKHNDLEEVGHDTYHHTMFEMLGNWSFGDYFKKEAIAWAWELLTEVYKIDSKSLYVTVFEGSREENLEPDDEAREYWKQFVPEERILYGSKKDNFWEMGDTGPCGPCSEIHVDIRSYEEKNKIPGQQLVNTDHPLVIEIWNLVFIQFNRLSNGSLQPLKAKHVDTGMGFERLCMVLQGKLSNYDTDIFQPYIRKLSELTGKTYGKNEEADIAMRVISDHLRAVSFAIADGELPSNNKAGYVIRRILRRAVRYGYTFLDFREPFIHELVPVMVENMGAFFPELPAQKELIMRVIAEEEGTFLKTLATGITKFENYIRNNPENKIIEGSFAFELFDTYGFPVDLTQLMAREKGFTVDMQGFESGMKQQKERSRAAATMETQDWIELNPGNMETIFLGYESLQAEVKPLRYRKVTSKGKTFYQLVLDKTPFYAESGGQVGDRGTLKSGEITLRILDTQKENNLSVHIVDKIPGQWPDSFIATVDENKRKLTENNHSATHLMHSALRKVLGTHVQQKGSLVDEKRLRFDFSHFAKVTPEEIEKIEQLVNERIRANIQQEEHRELSMEDAQQMGAIALFGEKYGEKVRVIAFDKDYSAELCGGTHVHSTGQIGLFKIVSEGAIAAGIRRIEAVTGRVAEDFVNGKIHTLNQVREILKNPKDIVKALQQLQDENETLNKQIHQLQKAQAGSMIDKLKSRVQKIGNLNFITVKLGIDPQMAKDLAFEMKKQMDNLFLVIGHHADGKAGITLMISDNLVNEKQFHAGNIIRELASEIEGGGGGQPHFATAGGKNVDGLDKAIEKAIEFVKK